MPPVNPLIRLAALIVGVAVGLSAVGGAVLALAPLLAADQRPAWLLFGFELTILVAAAIAVLFGRGRFADAPGMALACVAGTILLGSAMGWQSAGREVGGIALTPFLLARAAAAATLGLCAAACVLSRVPGGRAWRTAILGASLGAPVIAAAGLIVIPAGRRALYVALGPSPGLQTALGLVAFVVLGICLSASVHLLVRAFEMGRTDGDSAPGTKH